jgi:hypothetical protein
MEAAGQVYITGESPRDYLNGEPFWFAEIRRFFTHRNPLRMQYQYKWSLTNSSIPGGRPARAGHPAMD